MTATLVLMPPLARPPHHPEMSSVGFPHHPPLPAERGVAVPFTVDDRFHSHAKVLALSLAARGLWVSVGSWSADHGTDGKVRGHVVASLGGTPELENELIAAGMWGRTGDGVEFHDWSFWNGPQADIEAGREPAQGAASDAAPSPAPRRAQSPGARRTALCRAPGLKRRLRARDGDLCRYCGAAVRWGMGRAADSGTWDWVDPLGAATEENIVTACKACGEDKAGRSLADAEMTLLPPGKRYSGSNASEDCNASAPTDRNASELGNDNSGASRNASGNANKRHSNAYTTGSPAQKRYTPANTDDDLDQSSIRGSQQPVPPLDARTRKAKPGSQEFRLHVIAAFGARTRIDITAEQADAIADDVLPRAKGSVPSPLAYVLRAVRSDGDPIGRWLPELAGRAPEAPASPPAPRRPAEREWCGQCYRHDDRNVYDDQGRPSPCPRCSPKTKPAWEAA